MKVFWQLFILLTVIFQFVPQGETAVAISLGSTVNDILKTSQAHDVILLTRDLLKDQETTDVLTEISQTLARNFSMINIIPNAIEYKKLSSFASREFIIYFYASEEELNDTETQIISENLYQLIRGKVQPKITVLTVLKKRSHNLMPLLKSLWNKNMVNSIVLERVKSGSSKKTLHIIHRYNLFTRHYFKEQHVPGTRYFNKLTNLHGHKLSIAQVNRYPLEIMKNSNPLGDIKIIDIYTLNVLSEIMNFTYVIQPTDGLPLMDQINGSYHGILPKLMNGDYDIIATDISMLYLEYVSWQFSQTSNIENWCFVVPKLRTQISLSRGILNAVVTGIGFMGIFWILSVLFKFNRHHWNFLRIFTLIIGNSVPSVPKRIVERIVFLLVLVTSARYTSLLWAYLTSETLMDGSEVQYDSLENLVESDLTINMHKQMFDLIVPEYKVLEKAQRLRKLIFSPTMYTCLRDLVNYQNISCFVDDRRAEVMAYVTMLNDKAIMEKTELCYIITPTSYSFQQSSPYVERMSDLLERIFQAGIRTKWYHDYMRAKSMKKWSEDSGKGAYINVLGPLLRVICWGYQLSLVAFLGEIIFRCFVDLEYRRRIAEWFAPLRHRNRRIRVKPRENRKKRV